MSSIYLSSLYGTPAPLTSTTQLLATAQSNAATAAANQIQQLSTNLDALTAVGTAISTRSSAYATLTSAMQTFTSALDNLRDSAQAAGITGSSTNAAVQVVVGANAKPSTYDVDVTQLAQAQVNVSNYVASPTQAASFGNGSLTIQVGNQAAVSVQITNAMDLNDVADAINGQDAGVDAQVVSNANGYRLQVTGTSTGTDHAVTYTEYNLALGLASNQTQTATDLQGTLDGASFTNDSNVVSDAIGGVTLAFSGQVTDATVTLLATADGAAASVQSFVTAYNTMVAALNTAQTSQTDYGVLDTLRGQLASLVGRLTDDGTGTFSALAQVGVSSNDDGTLRVDTTALNNAASLDAYSVGALFSGTHNGQSGLAYDLQQVGKSYAAPVTGILSQNQMGLTSQSNANARAVQAQTDFVETSTNIINANNVYYQTKLAGLTSDALLVQMLPFAG